VPHPAGVAGSAWVMTSCEYQPGKPCVFSSHSSKPPPRNQSQLRRAAAEASFRYPARGNHGQRASRKTVEYGLADRTCRWSFAGMGAVPLTARGSVEPRGRPNL
jgi:hypothetical protein